jgi:ABC-type dipeptide/oligopeptide/nickel transport system, ATPase component
VFTTPEPTAEISPDQGWELIWEELKRVGIAPGVLDHLKAASSGGKRQSSRSSTSRAEFADSSYL